MPTVWVWPIGDRFRLGAQDFVLTAHITARTRRVRRQLRLWPAHVRGAHLVALENAELLGPATLYEVNYRLLLPDTGYT